MILILFIFFDKEKKIINEPFNFRFFKNMWTLWGHEIHLTCSNFPWKFGWFFHLNFVGFSFNGDDRFGPNHFSTFHSLQPFHERWIKCKDYCIIGMVGWISEWENCVGPWLYGHRQHLSFKWIVIIFPFQFHVTESISMQTNFNGIFHCGKW